MGKWIKIESGRSGVLRGSFVLWLSGSRIEAVLSYDYDDRPLGVIPLCTLKEIPSEVEEIRLLLSVILHHLEKHNFLFTPEILEEAIEDFNWKTSTVTIKKGYITDVFRGEATVKTHDGEMFTVPLEGEDIPVGAAVEVAEAEKRGSNDVMPTIRRKITKAYKGDITFRGGER